MCILTTLIGKTKCQTGTREYSLELWPLSSYFIPRISGKQDTWAIIFLSSLREGGLGLLCLFGFVLLGLFFVCVCVWFVGLRLFWFWFFWKQISSKFCKQLFVQISLHSSGLPTWVKVSKESNRSLRVLVERDFPVKWLAALPLQTVCFAIQNSRNYNISSASC